MGSVRRSRWTIVLSVVVALGVLVVAAVILMDRPGAADMRETAVPNLLGLTARKAVSVVEKRGLRSALLPPAEGTASTGAPYDVAVVVGQVPAGGVTVLPRRAVEIKIVRLVAHSKSSASDRRDWVEEQHGLAVLRQGAWLCSYCHQEQDATRSCARCHSKTTYDKLLPGRAAVE